MICLSVCHEEHAVQCDSPNTHVHKAGRNDKDRLGRTTYRLDKKLCSTHVGDDIHHCWGKQLHTDSSSVAVPKGVVNCYGTLGQHDARVKPASGACSYSLHGARKEEKEKSMPLGVITAASVARGSPGCTHAWNQYSSSPFVKALFTQQLSYVRQLSTQGSGFQRKPKAKGAFA